VERRLIAITESRDIRSKSAMAELLLREALDTADLKADPQWRELLAAWRELTPDDRDRLVRTARSWLTDKPREVPLDPFPDPFDGVDNYHDGPPDDPRDFWERHKK